MTDATHSKTIHVVQILEATAGGTRTHMMHLLRGLDREKFRATLIASAERNPAFREDMDLLAAEGVSVVELPMARAVSPRKDYSALCTLKRLLREMKPDIVHTHASKAGVLGRYAARKGGVPCIVHTPHTYYFLAQEGARRRVYGTIESAASGWADRTVLLTESQRVTAQRELGLPVERVAVIPNGVDTDHFQPTGAAEAMRAEWGVAPDTPLVGTIGRFVAQKAMDVFIRALPEVFSAVPEARAVIVGTGPLSEPMDALARDLGIGDRIVRRRYYQDPREVYEALDVFALASAYEGLPYTLLEAMSMGRAVAVPRISGCADVVEDGVTGLLHEPGNPAALARGIQRLLADPGLRADLGKAARASVERDYRLDTFIENMQALYTELAARDT